MVQSVMLEKIKRIANYFPYCLTIVDVKSKGRPCVFVNNKFYENTGYDVQEAVGKNLSFLQGPLTSNDTRKFMRECFSEGLSCIQDIVNYKKDGTPFLNRLLMLPLNTDDHELFYVGFQNDITRIRGLIHNNDSLSKVNDGEIRHMINNPLTIILGKMAIALRNAKSEAEVIKVAKSLSDTFERINSFALNGEDVSNFEKFRC